MLLSASSVVAQPILFEDPVSAKTFNSGKYSEINGSPFLFEKWMTGSVTTSKGTYQNLSLKLDAYESTLIFNKDEQAREFTDPVITFTLIPDPSDSSRNMVFKNGITGPSLRADQYVQVLSEGKVSLYRSDIKLVSDVNEINKGVIKTFNNSTRYYIVRDGKAKLVKMNKKELLNELSDQQDKVEAYIKENKLSMSKDADLKSLFKYYNSL